MPRVLICLLAMLPLAACKEETPGPYLEFAGGSFVANYRNADVYYGFVVRPLKTLPEGAALVAEFEMPGGAAPGRVTQPVRAGKLQYMFRSPGLTGVETRKRYTAVLRLTDAGGKELERLSKSFVAEVGGESLPSAPLTEGPGYKPAPAAEELFKRR